MPDVSRLITAIKAVADEQNANFVRQHVRTIAEGVRELGEHMEMLERRIAHLEAKR